MSQPSDGAFPRLSDVQSSPAVARKAIRPEYSASSVARADGFRCNHGLTLMPVPTEYASMASEPALESAALAGPMREFRWHVVARTMVAVFLALTALLAFFLHYVVSLWPLLMVCGIILSYNVLLFRTSWHTFQPKQATLTSLVLDLVALTTYLHFSGDIENPLILAYSLPVVAGGVLLSRRSGFLLAGLGVLLFITLILMTTLDAFPVHVAHHHLACIGDLILHDRIDPDLDIRGWNYILAHLLTLTAVLFG